MDECKLSSFRTAIIRLMAPVNITKDRRKSSVFSGASGIRTREALLALTRFPGEPLKPLEHRSIAFCGAKLVIKSEISNLSAEKLRFSY